MIDGQRRSKLAKLCCTKRKALYYAKRSTENVESKENLRFCVPAIEFWCAGDSVKPP